jgi:hypothetical protein
MTTLQKTIIATVLTAAIGSGVYQGAENSKLRGNVETLRQQQAASIETARVTAEPEVAHPGVWSEGPATAAET